MSTPQPVVFSWQLPQAAPIYGRVGGVVSNAVGQLQLDASINEQHQKSAELTKHPVETGSDVTDNIRPLPGKLTIEGIVTNTLGSVPATYNDGVQGSVQTVTKTVRGKTISYNAFKFDAPMDRVREAYGDLGAAINGAAVFTVTTTLATYENMACTSFNATRNANNGNVLRFTAEFEAILFVQTQTVAALPGKNTKKHRGSKNTKAADPTTEKKARSALRALVKLFGG